MSDKNIKWNELRKDIKGSLHTDNITRALFSTDASIFQKEPAAVLYPANGSDVLKTVRFALKNNLTVHPRGAGSGLCGSSLGNGIIVDFTKYMNKLISIDLKEKTFECMPGYRLGQLEEDIKGTGLFFPPDPSSGEFASLGGMYSTNASGASSVKYGNVSDYILDAKIVTGNAETIRLSQIKKMEFNALPKNLAHLYSLYAENKELIETSYPNIRYNVSGYNLRGLVKDSRLCLEKLFAGSEGTLGIAVSLKFRLLQKPAYMFTIAAFFENISNSALAVKKLLKIKPCKIEIMDKSLLNIASENSLALKNIIPQNTDNLLLIEFDSNNKDRCSQMAEEAVKLLETEKLAFKVITALSENEKQKLWTIRKAAVPILYKLKGKKKILALIEDAAVPIENIEKYFKGILDTLCNVNFVIYGHISKGLLHIRPLLDLKDPKDAALLKPIADKFFDLVDSLDGVISAEHGDGRIRSCYIPRKYPKLINLFLETKKVFDRKNILNPEIKTVYDQFQMQKDLRFKNDYEIDGYKNQEFLRLAEKCHGCSQCTTVTYKTRMCPVYKLTRTEQASPKAKANILRSILYSNIISEKDFKDAVKKVVNLCINCGNCSKECPSNTDIPKLVADARALYIKRFGIDADLKFLKYIETGTKTAGKLFSILKPFTKKGDPRLFSEKIKTDNLTIIKSAKEKVIYFKGCYSSFIRQKIADSAIKVMRQANISVYEPKEFCCGLPLFSKGLVNETKTRIEKNINSWKDCIIDADYIVATCPSCAMMIKDIWPEILKNDLTKEIRSKVIYISSLLIDKDIVFSSLKDKKIKGGYHTPCHLKISENPLASFNMLAKVYGDNIYLIEKGCCGMAGTWGMYPQNLKTSMAIGQDLADSLKKSNIDFTVTDCPACEMQLKRLYKKPAFHPVEVAFLGLV